MTPRCRSRQRMPTRSTIVISCREDRPAEETGRAEEAGSAKTTRSEQSAAAKQGSEEQRRTKSVAEPAERFRGPEGRRQTSARGFQEPKRNLGRTEQQEQRFKRRRQRTEA